MQRLFINMLNVLSEVRDQERGAAGVEYGILVAAIAAVIVALAFLIGGEIKNAFQTVYNELV